MIRQLSILMSILISVTTFAWAEVPDYIKSAVNNAERPKTDTMYDANRKPAEVLSFIGLKPGMKVADLLAGSGYYTEIIRNVVGKEGHVIAHNNFYVRGRFIETLGPGSPWEKRLNSESWKKNVTPLFSDLDQPNLPDGLDAAVMVLFYHDTAWQGTERDKMNKAIFDDLKSGGVYAIIDHSAEKGSGIRDVKTLHRIDKDLVIREVEAAGFKLAATSDVLSNAEDKRDYHVFRDFKTNRYSTDRFILKFIKP